MDRFAAVIVNHRTPDETVRAVDALRRSRRPLDDLIVVDNASGDDSAERFRALEPPLTVLAAPSNLGFAGGANLGIREALSRDAVAVLLVNSDALVDPDCAGRLEAMLANRPDVGVAAPVIVSSGNPPTVLSAGIRFSPTTGRVLEQTFPRREVDAVSGAVMLVRAEVFRRLGLIDEAYFFSFEDVDFCVRARAAGFASVCVPDATARHAGSRTIGRRSPRRLYFATRNHLRLAARVAPAPSVGRHVLRTASIVSLNIAHALLTSEAPRLAGLAAVLRGGWDHARGRYGVGCV